MGNILEIENLHFQYGEIKALHGISLNVQEGEVVTLLGGNGAGKTTTLSAISGLDRGITQGEIRFMGEKINRCFVNNILYIIIVSCLPSEDLRFQFYT